MLPDWHFLLDRGVNFRTKRVLLVAGFPEVLQLADVGLTGLAKDGEIFRTAQQKRLILITKDTDKPSLSRTHVSKCYTVNSKLSNSNNKTFLPSILAICQRG